MLFTILIVLIAIIGVIMTLVVLLQSGQGGGLAGIASGSTTQILGSRQAPDVLEKATWTLATAFIVLCVLTNFTITEEVTGGSVIQERAGGAQGTEQVIPPPADAPPADDAGAPAETPPGDGN